eukprot:8026867-Ditylum_brightwellii.AAC.1
MPPIACSSFSLQALQQIEYHMVTSYGVSDTGVTHSTSQPINGHGHGATNTLPNWTLISNVCQKAYEKH